AVSWLARSRISRSCTPACPVPFNLFFFQAEDGIRDPLVTGVQTCALPIFILVRRFEPKQADHTRYGGRAAPVHPENEDAGIHARSEERRVGKECRSRWSG